MNALGHTVNHSEQCCTVLQCLSQQSAGIWCLLDVDTCEIKLCSQSFRRFWNLPDTSESRLRQRVTATQIEQARLADSWSNWLPSLPELLAEAASLSMFDGGARSLRDFVRCEDVVEHGMIVSGRMVTIEPPGVFCMTPEQCETIRRTQTRLKLLSDREAEVLRLVCDGLTNTAVARRLGISHKTVEKHRASIMSKMQLRSIPELVHGITLAQLTTC
ncbi:MAG: helix-turn-helix transcriptional regulator [Planctomycetaceae bacterium]